MEKDMGTEFIVFNMQVNNAVMMLDSNNFAFHVGLVKPHLKSMCRQLPQGKQDANIKAFLTGLDDDNVVTIINVFNYIAESHVSSAGVVIGPLGHKHYLGAGMFTHTNMGAPMSVNEMAEATVYYNNVCRRNPNPCQLHALRTGQYNPFNTIVYEDGSVIQPSELSSKTFTDNLLKAVSRFSNAHGGGYGSFNVSTKVCDNVGVVVPSQIEEEIDTQLEILKKEMKLATFNDGNKFVHYAIPPMTFPGTAQLVVKVESPGKVVFNTDYVLPTNRGLVVESYDNMDYSDRVAIGNVREINNFAKAVMISEWVRPYTNNLDMCAGKGSDVAKWSHAGAGSVTLIDGSAASVAEAAKRSEEISTMTRFKFLVKDCLYEDLPHFEINKYDNAACNFALQYAFESRATADRFIHNLVGNVADGGTVMMIYPDPGVMRELIYSRLPDVIEGDKVINEGYARLEIKAQNYRGSSRKLFLTNLCGLKYAFSMGNIHGVDEYIVDEMLLNELMVKNGFKLRETKNLLSYAKIGASNYRNMCSQMKACDAKGVLRIADEDTRRTVGLYKVAVYSKPTSCATFNMSHMTGPDRIGYAAEQIMDALSIDDSMDESQLYENIDRISLTLNSFHTAVEDLIKQGKLIKTCNGRAFIYSLTEEYKGKLKSNVTSQMCAFLVAQIKSGRTTAIALNVELTKVKQPWTLTVTLDDALRYLISKGEVGIKYGNYGKSYFVKQ